MEGYNEAIEKCISTEFPHLNGITYLDHTGTTLYAASQLRKYHEDLTSNVYGNPHSHCASSQLTTDTIEQVRYRILEHFNTTPDHHSVIFTSGCTGALKLLCETFNWSGHDTRSDPSQNVESTTSISHDASQTTHNSSNQKAGIHSGVFCCLEDNHTSVIGMRQIAKEKGAKVIGTSVEKIEDAFQENAAKTYLPQTSTSNNLFAYPGQSNFSGQKYPLDWSRKVKQGHLSSFSHCNHGNWFVVVDAAAMVATSPLDLSDCTADFVTVSFYKMFGFPTGLGALIIRKDAECVLRKSYFGGGTVLAYLSGEQFHAPKPSIADWFEDGTVPFLDIVAVRHGFDTIDRIAGGITPIQKHTFALAKYVHDKMATFHHGNGSPVARLYCHKAFEDMESQGPIINFNLLRPNGDYVGYAEVDSLAALHDIHLRTGCFCNTGACQTYLDLSSQQIKDNFQAGHVCGDDIDLINGQPTGSIRISFGYMSTKADADNFLKFIKDCFVKQSCVSDGSSQTGGIVGQMRTMQDEANLKDVLHDTDASHTLDHSDVEIGEGDRVRDSSLCKSNTLIGNKSQTLPQDAQQMSTVASTSVSEESKTVSCTIDGCHGNKGIFHGVERARNAGNKMVLTNIFLYPIKSCGAMEVSEWDLGPRGLLYDRHWMIVNSSGVCLSQKREINMCLIKPHIDLHAGVMKLSYPGLQTMAVPLEASQIDASQVIVSKLCHSKVCGDRVEMFDCGDPAAEWLEAALGKSCRLLQQNVNSERDCKFKQVLSSDQKAPLSLAQESPYLLLNRASCKVLMENVQQKKNSLSDKEVLSESHIALTEQEKAVLELENLLGRFRGNLVIDNVSSFQEDEWKKVQIGHQVFLIGGLCSRCQMICINQDTAERSKEPLLTLTTFRGKRVPFGVHLLRDPCLSTTAKICVNDTVTVLESKT